MGCIGSKGTKPAGPSAPPSNQVTLEMTSNRADGVTTARNAGSTSRAATSGSISGVNPNRRGSASLNPAPKGSGKQQRTPSAPVPPPDQRPTVRHRPGYAPPAVPDQQPTRHKSGSAKYAGEAAGDMVVAPGFDDDTNNRPLGQNKTVRLRGLGGQSSADGRSREMSSDTPPASSPSRKRTAKSPSGGSVYEGFGGTESPSPSRKGITKSPSNRSVYGFGSEVGSTGTPSPRKPSPLREQLKGEGGSSANRKVVGRDRAASGKFGFDFGVQELESEESTADALPGNRPKSTNFKARDSLMDGLEVSAFSISEDNGVDPAELERERLAKLQADEDAEAERMLQSLADEDAEAELMLQEELAREAAEAAEAAERAAAEDSERREKQEEERLWREEAERAEKEADERKRQEGEAAAVAAAEADRLAEIERRAREEDATRRRLRSESEQAAAAEQARIEADELERARQAAEADARREWEEQARIAAEEAVAAEEERRHEAAEAEAAAVAAAPAAATPDPDWPAGTKVTLSPSCSSDAMYGPLEGEDVGEVISVDAGVVMVAADGQKFKYATGDLVEQTRRDSGAAASPPKPPSNADSRKYATEDERVQAQASTEATNARLEDMTFDFSFGAAAPAAAPVPASGPGPEPEPEQSPSFAPVPPPPAATATAASEPVASLPSAQIARRSSMDEARRKLEQRVRAETEPAVTPEDPQPPTSKKSYREYATEDERVQAEVSVDDTHARLEGMTFDFSFGAAPTPEPAAVAAATSLASSPPSAADADIATPSPQPTRRQSMEETRKKLEARVTSESEPNSIAFRGGLKRTSSKPWERDAMSIYDATGLLDATVDIAATAGSGDSSDPGSPMSPEPGVQMRPKTGSTAGDAKSKHRRSIFRRNKKAKETTAASASPEPAPAAAASPEVQASSAVQMRSPADKSKAPPDHRRSFFGKRPKKTKKKADAAAGSGSDGGPSSPGSPGGGGEEHIISAAGIMGAITAAKKFAKVLKKDTKMMTVAEIEAADPNDDVWEELDPRAIDAAKWTDREIARVISEIKQRGYEIDDGSGRTGITFGQLFDETDQIFDALSGILKTSKKYGVVAFEGEQLWQGQNDHTEITLLKEVHTGIKIKRRKRADLKSAPANSKTKGFGNEFTHGMKCVICSKTIYQAEYVGASGKGFHKACFRCFKCNKALSQTGFCVSADRNFRCEAHHKEFEMGQL